MMTLGILPRYALKCFKNIGFNVDYSDFLKDKRVVIVGPAPSIIGSQQGKSIDDYDVVVRINKALPVPKTLYSDIGSKTDVLYNCLNPAPDCGGPHEIDLWARSTKWVCSPYPEIYPFDKDIRSFNSKFNNEFNFRIFDKSYYQELVSKLNCRPNSGILAILDILSFNPKEVYVTGFTFFRGGFYKEYRNITEEQINNKMSKVGAHKQEPQINLVKEIYKSDSRFRVDSSLKEILEE